MAGVRWVDLELLAQLTDEDAEVLRLLRRPVTPDLGQQRAMRNHAVGVASHVDEQAPPETPGESYSEPTRRHEWS